MSIINKTNNKIFATLLSLLTPLTAIANDQLSDNTPRVTALTHATIVIEPGKVLTNASLLIENNKIKNILANNKVPEGALVIDLTGHTIYPGFIDPFSNYAIEYSVKPQQINKPVYEIKRIGGNAANGAIHSEKEWFNYVYPNKENANDWIKNGFTSVQSSSMDGIFKGRAVTLSLANKKPNDIVYNSKASHFMAFDKGSSIQDYPESLMGSIALIRQTFSDARWYHENRNKTHSLDNTTFEFNAALERLGNLNKEHIVFDTRNLNNALRAARLLSEHQLNASLVGSGYEYARINELKTFPYSLILPLNFPAAPQVSDPDTEREVSLAQLRHWERAPMNIAAVSEAEIPFALTQHGIDAKHFWPRLKRAIAAGLNEDAALAALTTQAAKIAGTEQINGKIKPGYMADFVVSKGNIFTQGKITSVWLQGIEQPMLPLMHQLLDNQYQIQLDEVSLDLNIDRQDKGQLTGTLSSGEEAVKLENIVFNQGRLTFNADLSEAGLSGNSRFTLWLDEQGVRGRIFDEHNISSPIGGVKINEIDDEPSSSLSTTKQVPTLISALTSPNVAFGLSERPKQQRLHIKNATVWTSDKQGILENTDVIIAKGKIERIGQNLPTPANYTQIDATGMHVTAGIVDEHSHIALNGGTNEGTDAVTSEVRIGDVINPDDIAIYRSLSGGVTTAQILHGSANPIGGQAQLIQLRWGDNAEQLKFNNAPTSIKFALGENVKQSNWGDEYNQRFPQSRIGVKALFSEAFNEALAYRESQEAFASLRSSERRQHVAPRQNYRLEAVAQVLSQERDVHIHSYVQSEVLMFLRLAEAYNFKAGTFTHILEGYKVADEMAQHGAMASTFSDWWAYKFEVYDAIPQNTCLMQSKGVLTSINSDDNEMQRRLNQEAAKSMMYCDMPAEDAWNMVTINPAIQLGIDKITGSLKRGKQADIVLWDANPLSVYAKVDSTWIEGRRYFNRHEDKLAQRSVQQERAALIQKILTTKDELKQGEVFQELNEPVWHCDTRYNAWQHSAKGAH